jgi:hypothetical protein
MDRRGFLSASAASLAAGAASAAETGGSQFFELKEYQLRNSKAGQQARLTAFFEAEHLPMTKRVGVAAAGYFSMTLGEFGPRLFSLMAFNSLAHMQETLDARAADKAWAKASTEFGKDPNPPFDRVKSRLLRAFDGMKKIEVPKLNDEIGPRLFDLRTYEAETFADMREKMNMFNSEEIGIFRKTGINPLLFGETIVGDHMPNITYMAWYDDMAARDKAWAAFLSDPDWIRIRSKAGWGNDDIVATVSNIHLRPFKFSPIR